ncbi:hypothetical protein DFJ43DRAFT_1153316 [Lentinula guzmanii]|uniref:Uncharacterized protein n=1 Tax=Lentinula guzmanii TaxID=2804957 RepID=A0AA38JNE5_9AGAR|nr:hypothetical protein DFJ43DRAFT_1153316 [Lentinula guzmanii]
MPVGHMVLAIDDLIVEAVWADRPACTRLGPKKSPLKPDSSTYDWFPLGKAKFESKELAFEALLSIKMPLFKETGGKCMDYVESALKTLAERNELLRPASVMEKFEERKKIFVTLMTGQQK